MYVQVNGESVIGMPHNKAVALIKNAKRTVLLAVTRQIDADTTLSEPNDTDSDVDSVTLDDLANANLSVTEDNSAEPSPRLLRLERVSTGDVLGQEEGEERQEASGSEGEDTDRDGSERYMGPMHSTPRLHHHDSPSKRQPPVKPPSK